MEMEAYQEDQSTARLPTQFLENGKDCIESPLVFSITNE
jgi:hypothetical protein